MPHRNFNKTKEINKEDGNLVRKTIRTTIVALILMIGAQAGACCAQCTFFKSKLEFLY
jgi:hypothetical protein